MVLRLKDKEVRVTELKKIAGASLSVIAADYRGSTVSEMNHLRSLARESGVYFRVERNTLSHRALENTEFKCLQEVLEGPVVLAFSHNEPGAAARILKNFILDHEKFKIRAIAIGGQLLAANQLDAVAKLPTRDEAISLLMAVIQAPIVKLVRTLNETNGKLVRTFAAVAAAKEKAGG